MHQVRLRRYVVIILVIAAFLGFRLLPAMAHGSKGDSQQVGKWKTFVLSSGGEIAVPAPPAENSDQAKAELAELQQIQLSSITTLYRPRSAGMTSPSRLPGPTSRARTASCG